MLAIKYNDSSVCDICSRHRDKDDLSELMFVTFSLCNKAVLPSTEYSGYKEGGQR